MKKKHIYKMSLDEQRDLMAIRAELRIAKQLEKAKNLGKALLDIPESYRWAPWRCL